MASKTVSPCEMYVNRNSTELKVVVGSTAITLSSTSVVGNNLSTAVTGSTVLTAALALASELNTTNQLINEIKATLVALGLASS